jgi:hypothetical protein
MNVTTKLDRIRDLVNAKVLKLQPMAGEEMNLPQSDAHRDGFVDGERTLARQILSILDEDRDDGRFHEMEPLEEEMVLGLGQT